MRGKCFLLVFVAVVSVFLLASSGWGQEGKDVESLILDLKSEDWITRQSAAEALGLIGDARAVEPLIDALRDEDIRVCMAAVGALAMIGDRRAVEPLVEMLGNVCALTEDDLSELGPLPLTDNMGNVYTLKEIMGLAYNSVIFALNIIVPWWRETEEAKKAGPKFIAALKDRNAGVRLGAIAVLGEIRDPRAIEPLIDALRDENEEVRKAAAWALGNITKEDFGQDPERWLQWFKENRPEKK